MNRKLFKSIGAILAGFIVVIIFSTATDFILEKIGILPGSKEEYGLSFDKWWLLLLALSYRSVYTVVGGYFTAKLAPDRPMRHVIILATLGFVAGTSGAIATWDLAPHWYPVLLAITGPFFVWLGGILFERKTRI